jgi:hypothetical protein
MVAGILTPQEAFAGFGSEIIIILASVFIISGPCGRPASSIGWVALWIVSSRAARHRSW